MRPQGVRATWDQVPAEVRAAVAAELGSEVVSAVNQPGGFSPGVAARCGLADGRRCFIKAVSPDQNPESPAMHRREARASAALPDGLPVPRLLHTVDDGRWIVLVFEEIDGSPPAQPWRLDDLAATFRALDELAARTTPCPVPDLPAFAELHAPLFHGFRTLAGGRADAAIASATATPTDGTHDDGDGSGRGRCTEVDRLATEVDRLDPWTRRHLDRLADLEGGWADAAAGDSLLHADLRADNLLVRTDGSIVVVDWPSACVGAAWVDKAFLLPSVGLDGGPTPGSVVEALDPFAGVDPEALDRVLAALAGYFTYHALRPAPPGLPTLRAFQHAQGEVARAWLADRLALR